MAGAMIVAACAGLQAGLIFSPQADKALAQDDDTSALELSSEHAVLPKRCGSIGDDAHDAYPEGLRKEARSLVREHQSLVIAVAAALMEKKELTGDAAKEGMQAAGGEGL